MSEAEIKRYLARIGRKGGSKNTAAQNAARAKNAKRPRPNRSKNKPKTK